MEGNMCMNGMFDCSTWAGISEQQILDCGSYRLSSGEEREYFDFHGCSGGWQSNVIQFNYYVRGVVDSADYPYVSGTTGKTNECQQMPRTAYPDRYICGTLRKKRPTPPLSKKRFSTKDRSPLECTSEVPFPATKAAFTYRLAAIALTWRKLVSTTR